MKFKKKLALISAALICVSSLPINAVGTKDNSTYEVYDLKTDAFAENMQAGIIPEFSWKIQSDRRGAAQSKYRILAATSKEDLSPDDSDLVWDSGLVLSDSQKVTYTGTPLSYESRYFWKVIVVDELGQEHSSDVCEFTTELDPDTLFGSAKWIGSSNNFSNTKKYTVEARMKIESNSTGLVFAAEDGNNFYLWQFNEKVAPGKIMMRPHKWKNGSISVLGEIDVSSYMKNGEGFRGWHVFKIEVDGQKISTYIDGSLVSTLTDSSPLPCGSLGIRNVQSADDNQVSWYDYMTLTDNTTGDILQHEDFSGTDELTLAFNCGTVNNGLCKVTGNWLAFYNKIADGGDITWMRKEFDSKTPVRATISVTALGVYELYLNGNRIGEDYLNPGWTDYYIINQGKTDSGNLFYQTYDVTDMILDGKNSLGAVVGTGWYNGKLSTFGTNIYGSDNYLIAKLVLEYADGKTVILTDNTWKYTHKGPVLYSDLENGEIYDANRELGKWTSVGYNDSSWYTVDAVSKAYTGKICKQIGESAKIVETLPAESVTKHKNGNYIVDLGQNITGWIYLNDVSGTKGNRITMKFGEMLYDNGTVYQENLRTAKATDYYIFSGADKESWRPSFTFHGFRYVEIEGYEGDLKPENIIGEVVSADIERTGFFKTSDEKINKLYENIYWGQIDNFLSVPMGCPQRDERLGWTGDINVFAMTATYNSNCLEFLRKFNFDLQMAQGKSGEYTDIAPRAILAGEAAGGWADTGILIPYTCYKQFGDISVAGEFWSNMEKFMDFLDKTYGSGKSGNDKYIRNSLRYGDHLNVNSITAYDLIGTAYYAYDAKAMSEMATALGKTEDAEKYAQLFETVKAVYIDKFVTDEGRVYGAGAEPAGYDKETQTGYVLSLYMDLLPDHLRDKAAGYLVDDIRARDMHLTTGFMGISMLMPTLTACGYSDIAYELLLQNTYPSWLYSVDNGATTIWERWNSWTETDGFADITMNSFNHYALGSVGEWYYSAIGGISNGDTAGYKDFVIAPQISEKLGFAETAYTSTYGKITSNWKIADETVTYTVSVPANTTATLKMMYRGLAANITESGTSVNEAVGVTFLRTINGVAEYKLASGSYTFVVPYVSDGPIDDPAEVTAEITTAVDTTAEIEDTTAENTTLGEETSAESEIYEDESTSAALSEALGDSETSTDTEAKGCKSSLIGGMAALLSAAGAFFFKKKCKEI